MVVDRIYYGSALVNRIYHAGEVIYQRDPIIFQYFVDDNLIIDGALSAVSLADGLYLDCVPDWTYPVIDGSTLTVQQVYSATQTGTTLEVT